MPAPLGDIMSILGNATGDETVTSWSNWCFEAMRQLASHQAAILPKIALASKS
jgi:hypothetical protein